MHPDENRNAGQLLSEIYKQYLKYIQTAHQFKYNVGDNELQV